MPLPPIHRIASADPFQRGILIGTAAGDLIHRSIEIYQAIFAHYAQLSWRAVVEHAGRFRKPIGDYDAGILAEIDGMAAGAELPADDVLALNVRSEIMFGLKARPEAECTSFFAGPSATADGHTLLGQNWDWKPDCAETAILLEIDQGPELPSLVTVVEAGMVAKAGFNSAGVGMATNTLISPMDSGQPLVPYHVLLRRILNSWTIEEAVSQLVGARRAASANYLIADRAGIGVSVETAPGGVEAVHLVHPRAGVIGHSNNFTCNIDFVDVGAQEFPDSPGRVAELSSLLEAGSGRLDRSAIKRALTSHENSYPDSICRHPNVELPPIERLATDASALFDLTTLTAEITNGRPCEHEYVSYVPEFAEGGLP